MVALQVKKYHEDKAREKKESEREEKKALYARAKWIASGIFILLFPIPKAGFDAFGRGYGLLGTD